MLVRTRPWFTSSLRACSKAAGLAGGVNAGATVTAAAHGLLGRPVRVPVSEILKRRDVRRAEAADDLFLSPSSRRMVLHSLSQVSALSKGTDHSSDSR